MVRIRHSALIIFAITITAYSLSMPAFFNGLYIQDQKAIDSVFSGLFGQLCAQINIDPHNAENRKAINSILFYHQLLTTTDAVDCTKGGILKTAYFWHWTDPNPRHSIRRLPDSALLVTLPPVKGYERYKTYADMDRLPLLYCSDLISENPKYVHPSCGSFYTFGWCSEGIHVWSEVLLELSDSRKRKQFCVITADNTFNAVNSYTLNNSIDSWKKDFGSGAQVAYYNKVAKAADQVRSLREIKVSGIVEKRIRSAVSDWLLKK